MAFKINLYDQSANVVENNLVWKMALAGQTFVYQNVNTTTGAPLAIGVTNKNTKFVLWNPSTNVKSVFIYSAEVRTGQTNVVTMMSALASDPGLTAGGSAKSMHAAGTASVVTLEYDTQTTPTGPVNGTPVYVSSTDPSNPTVLNIMGHDELYEIDPGQGLEVYLDYLTAGGSALPIIITLKGFEVELG